MGIYFLVLCHISPSTVNTVFRSILLKHLSHCTKRCITKGTRCSVTHYGKKKGFSCSFFLVSFHSFIHSFIHSVVLIYLSTLVFFPLLLPSRHFCLLRWIVKMGFAGFFKIVKKPLRLSQHYPSLQFQAKTPGRKQHKRTSVIFSLIINLVMDHLFIS